MDKNLKNSVNFKEYNLTNSTACAIESDKFGRNSCTIPTKPTGTIMPPVILPPPTTAVKDATGLNQCQSSQCRSARQRIINLTTEQNINCNNNATSPSLLTQQEQQKQQYTQLTTVQKSSNNNKTHSNNNNVSHSTLMNSKAAACIASPMEQLAAFHAKVTSSRSRNEEAIHDLRTRIPEIENIFDLHSRIGNGTFSTVLLGTLKKERDLPENLKRKFAIKHHIPTSHPDRIMKELQCMAKIGGTDNVVGINCCIRYNESVAFIMPYLAHDRFYDFYNKMDVAEVQFYMKNLLIALRHVHRFNVIHRDIKPSNFLYNRRKKQFLLVDFGLAQQVPSSHGSLENNNLTGKLANLSLPAATGGEGKRTYEHDDSSANKSQDDSVTVSGTDAKRIRCIAPMQEQTQTTLSSGHTTRATTAANNGSKGAVAGGSNVNLNDPKTTGGAVVHNMSSRLQQKLRAQGCTEAVSHSSTRTSSAGGGKSTLPVTSAANTNNNNNNSVDTKYNTNRNLTTSNSPKCYCYGNPQVCNICLVKKEIHASRAGTPGYRPPEVLLKYPDQTTAVDIWAAGVIFLSVLSSVYPFFKAPNDYIALAEIVAIFGDRTIRKTAFKLDRLVTLSQKTKPLDLRTLCVRYKNREKYSSAELLKKHQRPDGTCEVCKNCDQFFYNCLCMESPFETESLDNDDMFPPSAYDLLYCLLEVNPHKRITADEALRHPFFVECYSNNNNVTTSNSTSKTNLKTNVVAPNATPSVSLAAAGDSPNKSLN